MEYWTPTKEWDRQEAFIIGGGPSLRFFDFQSLRGRNVIGCNDAFRLGKEIVKYNLFGDSGWWMRFYPEIVSSDVLFVTNSNALSLQNVPRAKLLKMRRQRDGIHSGDTLGWNYSTGACAINLAVSLGATSIYLLGFDMGHAPGASHWHEYNPAPIQGHTVKRFAIGFDNVKKALPEGVDVVNITDGTSRLESFPRASFDQLKDVLSPAPVSQEVAA